ncbi:F-box protein pallbearer isoform X1 [Haematobia irritans]|uniref:F-box protein pallbearer isoform X1 n=1 Tax=Haematobia irritans TaxID=7368 RepID=UPI003F50492A
MNILDLPSVILLEIFEYLSYDEVSKKRLVCRRFDQISQQVLNGGFNKVIKQHTINFKRIKALLPRRESERRNHCLARHADILTSIETRISMLSMTYTKYMDLNLCCFIPGKVLDEIFRILRLIAKTNKPLRPHEVLQELRDISSMAIEHFDEKIVVHLKKSFSDNSNNSSKICCPENRRLAPTSGGLGNISFSGMGGASPPLVTPYVYGSNEYILEPLTHRLGLIGDRLNGSPFKGNTSSGSGISDQQSPSTSSSASTYTGDMHPQHSPGRCPEAHNTMLYCKKLETEYKKGFLKMQRMQQIQNMQSKRLQQALSSVAELNVQIVELKKRLEDVDAKNREISANIRHINGGGSPETANKATTPPSSSMCNSSDDITDEVSKSMSTSSSTAKTLTESHTELEIKAIKRRCEDSVATAKVAQATAEAFNDAISVAENCDLPCMSSKKAKLEK